MNLCSAYMFCDGNSTASIGLQFVIKDFSTNRLKAPFHPNAITETLWYVLHAMEHIQLPFLTDFLESLS
jgi:hypothetical protein